MAQRTLIVGAGYVGLPLARLLRARGEEVTAWVRSPDSAASLAGENFAGVIAGSVADDAPWAEAGRFDAVVHCAASSGGGSAAYREVYRNGARQMKKYQPEARRIFVSSTSVYGQADGAWVDETSPTQPAVDTGRLLLEAEAETPLVLRAAGIYGPGRAAAFEKFRRGEAVIEDGGTRWMNHVHRDDLVAALVHLLDGNAPDGIYNAADNEPVMQREFYIWCGRNLGLPSPRQGTADPNRKRGLTNKRVSNQKLRATGWAPQFPTFREGLAERLRA